jgi:hypothetical protein
MARKSNIPLLLGILGGIVAFAFTQRKTIMIYGAKAVTGAGEAIFAALLPDRAQPYADVILRVAREKSGGVGPAGVIEPWLVFALGDRESGWGIYLSPPGPAGTGDQGHGHGLMQIDDRSHAPWLAANDWTDPYVNVSKGVEILKENLNFFGSERPVANLTDGVFVWIGPQAAARRGVEPGNWPDPRPLQGIALYEAAIAAYNTGAGNVLMNLAAGQPAEFTTAGQNYASDVTARALALASKFAAQAPA